MNAGNHAEKSVRQKKQQPPSERKRKKRHKEKKNQFPFKGCLKPAEERKSPRPKGRVKKVGGKF